MTIKRFILISMIILMPVVLAAADDLLPAGKFASVREDEGRQLVLQGTGLKKVFFMKAFAAGLYLEKNTDANDTLGDVAKRIEVSYYVNISGAKLTKYTDQMIGQNTTPKEYESLKSRIEMMGEYFVDLKPGDRYALTYLPSIGTKFEHNGRLVGVIEGKDFAKGIFSVWIGPKPMDKTIKAQMLKLPMAALPQS